jgi:Rrf2 family iron-sulfur cluster assembly transcriptional regulator
MKLGTKGRYAVTALVDLAYYQSNQPVTLLEIADRQHLPVSYLEQIFLKLRKMGLVQSFRGHKGGYVLGKDPERISVSEIIKAVDESLKTRGCVKEGKPCRGSGSKCQTHYLWETLDLFVEEYLAQVTLKDICEGTLRRIL